jgi:hypothetical protein
MAHKYYIDTNNEYVELMYGEDTPEGFTPVPRREAEWFDLVDGVWVKNQDLHDEKAAEGIRVKRSRHLYVLDKVVSNPLRWADLGADKQSEWAQYRADLLNVTDQEGFPHNVTWPNKP